MMLKFTKLNLACYIAEVVKIKLSVEILTRSKVK